MQAGAGLAQQVQAVVQQLGAGSRVQVLQLLHRDLRLHVHDAQDEGRVLDLKGPKKVSHTIILKMTSVGEGAKESCNIKGGAVGENNTVILGLGQKRALFAHCSPAGRFALAWNESFQGQFA